MITAVAANIPNSPSSAPTFDKTETNATQIRVVYSQVAVTGGTPIISYQLQRTSADGTGFFDIIGS